MKGTEELMSVEEHPPLTSLVEPAGWLAVFAEPTPPFWRAYRLLGLGLTEDGQVIGLYARGPVIVDASAHDDFLAYLHEEELTPEMERDLYRMGRRRFQAVGTAPVLSIARRREA